VEGHIRFAELLELHITQQINKKFTGEVKLDNQTLHEMRDLVKDKIYGVFKKSSHKVTDAGLDWLVNEVFKHLTVKGTDGDGKPVTQHVYELVVFNEYKLDALPYSDIQLLRNLFNQAPYGKLLEEEYRRRSAA